MRFGIVLVGRISIFFKGKKAVGTAEILCTRISVKSTKVLGLRGRKVVLNGCGNRDISCIEKMFSAKPNNHGSTNILVERVPCSRT
jgi:hypothetical protein